MTEVTATWLSKASARVCRSKADYNNLPDCSYTVEPRLDYYHIIGKEGLEDHNSHYTVRVIVCDFLSRQAVKCTNNRSNLGVFRISIYNGAIFRAPLTVR
jgi:hypothetical protein